MKHNVYSQIYLNIYHNCSTVNLRRDQRTRIVELSKFEYLLDIHGIPSSYPD